MMTKIAMGMTLCAGFGILPFGAIASAASLQSEGGEAGSETADDRISTTSDGRTVIDILAPVPDRGPVSEADLRECEEKIDSSLLTGEIVVCGNRGEDLNNYYSGSRNAARKRYAEETAFANDIRAPDVAGEGIFRGPATVANLCFIPPCPKDPALIIDVEALPEAPEGSDADRIAHGLPPLLGDEDDELSEAQIIELRRARAAAPPPAGQKDE